MLILLDIDGVMVPAKGWKRPELLKDGFPAFSSMATVVLQKLISDDTTILLTTSHKSNFTIDEWKAIFRMRGINVRNMASLDSNVNNISRKDEILNWFNLNKVNEQFIIIDDDKSLNGLPDPLKENLVLTSPYVGLSQGNLEEAQNILRA